MRKNKNHCGGTIYSPNVIITSGKCCYDVGVLQIPWDDYDIVAGEHSLTNHDSQERRLDILDHLIHPGFNHTTLENDICLLYLDGEFDLSGEFIKSLPLAVNDTEDGAVCQISGWGKLNVS